MSQNPTLRGYALDVKTSLNVSDVMCALSMAGTVQFACPCSAIDNLREVLKEPLSQCMATLYCNQKEQAYFRLCGDIPGAAVTVEGRNSSLTYTHEGANFSMHLRFKEDYYEVSLEGLKTTPWDFSYRAVALGRILSMGFFPDYIAE